jgi:hypothetical protein
MMNNREDGHVAESGQVGAESAEADKSLTGYASLVSGTLSLYIHT